MHTTKLAVIAKRYSRAPELDVRAIPAWEVLADYCRRHAEGIHRWLKVLLVEDAHPYSNAEAMFCDIYAGQFKVSTAHCDHPVWSEEENINFRICHDVIGHFRALADFTWHGENLACMAHASHLSSLCERALFTECIAQTAYWNHFGHPPTTQKVVRLDHLI